MSERSSPDVFISYNWDKQDVIKALFKRLTENGLSCWMDIYQMGGGDSFYQRIDKGIRGCKVVISCVTEKYAESDNCCKEITLADALKKPIIPILLEEMTWPPAGTMGMLFAQLLYINCWYDKDLQLKWTGGKFDELVQKLRVYVPSDGDVAIEKNTSKEEDQTKKNSKSTIKHHGSCETDGNKPQQDLVIKRDDENKQNVHSTPSKTQTKEKKSPRRNISDGQNSKSESNTNKCEAKEKKPPLIYEDVSKKKSTDSGNQSTTAKVMAIKKSKLITAAIDFGTTYSGYAYGFKCDLEKNPPTIITNEWAGGRIISHKAPTCVLFNADKTMNSFGYEAEEKYAELCANDQHRPYYFFQRFKMMLDNSETFSRTTTITEEGGKRMPALDVFAAGICFIKKHLLESVRKRVKTICDDDVHWVLTVPAIWKDAAKLFMREAAEKAGISPEQLTIALEPESASVYCQRIPTEKMVDTDGAKLQIAEPHSKFMVLDAGGGTVDITVHERKADGTLKELFKASGGAWGGTKVDREFINLLKEIFGGEDIGNDIFRAFKEKSMEDYIDLLREFEVKKRDAKLEGGGRVTIKLPVSLVEIFEETGKKLKEVIGETQFGDQITLTGDKIKLDSDVIRTLFDASADSIVDHLRELFILRSVSDINTILMVGGFSGSCLIQNTVRKLFPSKKLFIPAQPDMAVLMGAVLFGANPDVISVRLSRFTYGTNTYNKFKPGEHPEDKKTMYDGEGYCSDCFFKLVGVNQILKVGESTVAKNYTPVKENQTSMFLKIYAASEESPKYVTDSCCQYLGSITIAMPDPEGGKNRKVEVKVNFSGTELEVEALEKTTMKTYKTKVNFLD